ncbi:MAG TPA: hypothetical protein VGB51_10330 [Actinomycetota bacterium]
MAIDEEARHRIHRRLEELLGSEDAAALMAQVAPVEWEGVATKADLRLLEERMRLVLRSELSALRAELTERIAELSEGMMRLSERMETQTMAFSERMEAQTVAFSERMEKQATTFVRSTVAAVIGSVLTVASLVFAARLF